MKIKIAVFMTIISCALFAQQGPDKPAPGAQNDVSGGKQVARPSMPGGDFKENIEDLKIARLKRKLDLTPEQAGKFFQAYFEMENSQKAFNKKRVELSEELNRMGNTKDIDENVLKQKLEEYERLETENFQKNIEYRHKLQDGLSVNQRVKLISFEREFNKYLTEMAKGMRNKQKPGNREMKEGMKNKEMKKEKGDEDNEE